MKKKQEADTKRKRTDMRTIQTDYAAMTLDHKYRVCTYGDAASSLFGFSEISMLGKPIGIILPDLAAKLETEVQASYRPVSELKMDALHANGKTFPVVVGMRQHNPHATCRHLVLVRNLSHTGEEALDISPQAD